MSGHDSSALAKVLFIGAPARGSLALSLVPRWASSMGRPVTVQPMDVSPGASAALYESLVEAMATSAVLGAVITGHKVGMFAAARGRCTFVSDDAALLGECSVLVARQTGMAAHATDVVSVGDVVDDLWPPAVTATSDASVVCLGAGGAGAALCLHLLRRAAPPRRIVMCERDEDRVATVAGIFDPIVERMPGVELVIETGDDTWDEVVEAAPGSLIVNATGLGKTSDQSPLSDMARFPTGAVVWDLNYRGPARFLRQANEQAQASHLKIHDGTGLFAAGWTTALGLLGLPTGPQDDERFAAMVREHAA